MIVERGLHCLILTFLNDTDNDCSSGVAGTESCFRTLEGQMVDTSRPFISQTFVRGGG